MPVAGLARQVHDREHVEVFAREPENEREGEHSKKPAAKRAFDDGTRERGLARRRERSLELRRKTRGHGRVSFAVPAGRLERLRGGLGVNANVRHA